MSGTIVASAQETLIRELAVLASVRADRSGVLITTHCMYPSNGLVRVMVRGGPGKFVVSDEGGAIDEAMSAGIAVTQSDHILDAFVKNQGLHFKEGVIRSPQVMAPRMALAALLVANASKEMAHWLFDHSKVRRTTDFRKRLAEFLNKTFDRRVSHDATVIGASNKPHKFANVVSLRDGRKLIVDPVIRDASSINARVVANLDVKGANDRSVIQRIVYDDEDEWSATDLNLLQIGAPLIQFSRFAGVIEGLAAHG